MTTKTRSKRIPTKTATRRTPKTRAGAARAKTKSTADAPSAPAATAPAPLASAGIRPARAGLPPVAGPRRAIFIDVENTSSEAELLRVIDDLRVDRQVAVIELTAVGNWRVIGQQLGRTLAARGAHLVHSAPATRVRDWSDLSIAVLAGMWLGRAQAGDVIDIISADRAFDAVGDAAARLGVTFHRISYRTHGAPASAAAEPDDERRGRRRRRRGRGGSERAAPPPKVAAAAAAEEPHAASQDHIRMALAQLTGGDPNRAVTLDHLTVALKAAGFKRPPGSPRLGTRLRRMKDVELLPSGAIRLVGAAAEVASAAAAAPPAAAAARPADGEDALPATNGTSETKAGKRRRRGRRGGRGRGKSAAAAPAS